MHPSCGDMFENGSYLRRRKRFKLPRNKGQIKDITAMAMADLQHYEASQRKAMLAAEQAKLRSLAAAVANTTNNQVFNNLNNLNSLSNNTNVTTSSTNSTCASPMSTVHNSIAQQPSDLTTTLSHHNQLINTQTSLSSPNSLNHLNKLSSFNSNANNNLLSNNSAVQQAAAAAAIDSLRNYGGFNMNNLLNGHRLLNQNSNLDQNKLNKTLNKNENSTLNHLGNLEGLFNKVGNKSSFSIDHLLNGNKDSNQDKKSNLTSNNNLNNGNSAKLNYEEQIMAAAKQQLAAMTALGFGLNNQQDKMNTNEASNAQLNEFYNQFLGANNYMNLLNNFNSNFNPALNTNALRHLNQNLNSVANNQLPNPFTPNNFHQNATNLLSTAGSANLTPNSNSPDDVCVDEQIEEKEQQKENDDDVELRSPMNSPYSVISGRSSTVNIEEDCD